MDHPVADRVNASCLGHRRMEGFYVQPAALLLDLVLVDQAIPAVEEAQLQAAGAGVDDQDTSGFQG
jgi:hypothetical protein